VAIEGCRTEKRRPRRRSVRYRQRLLPGGMVKLELVLEPDEADLIIARHRARREVHVRQAEPLETERLHSARLRLAG